MNETRPTPETDAEAFEASIGSWGIDRYVLARVAEKLERERDEAREHILPKDPPPGLLMSMALRYDHGLGFPGYYDTHPFRKQGDPTHEQRLAWTISTMRQLYEEVSGYGFYRPELEEQYAARIAPPTREGGE